jgi:hypothetical protein
MDYETQRARKFVFSWMLPFFVLFTALMFWFAIVAIPPMVNDLFSEPPIARIYPLAVLIPTFNFTMIVIILVGILKAIPVRRSVGKRAEWWMNALIFANVPILLFGIFVAGLLLESHFSSKGYTECHQLQGKPSRWFVDWVKNPEWCVKGKRPEWVREQARIAQEGKAPDTELKK